MEPDFAKILDAVRNSKDPRADEKLVEAAICQRSLIEFSKAAWHIIEPGRTFKVNWHHEAICDHLEAVYRRDIKRLAINCPFRSLKPVASDSFVVCEERGVIRLGDVKIGDRIWTHAGRFKEVRDVADHGVIPVLKIKTKHGRVIEAAPDHPFLTPNGWIEAKKLRVDDVLASVPVTSPCGTRTISSEEARLLGYLVGDGSCGLSPNVTVADDIECEDIKNCVTSLGFVPTEHRFHITKTGGTLRRITITSGQVITIRYKKGYRGLVRQWIFQHGLEMKNSYNKSVPDAIMHGNDEIVANFLGAYWACDGTIYRKNQHRTEFEKTTFMIRCDSVNKKLMEQIQILLLRLGINSTLRKKVIKLKTKKQGDFYTSYNVSLATQDDCYRFNNKIKVFHAKYGEFQKDNLRRFDFDRQLIGDVISSIEDGASAACRCLSVADDNSFTANGIAVHNSILVSVMFPIWTWTNRPSEQFICVSYAEKLAHRDNLKHRRIGESNWYRDRWGHVWDFAGDQNQKGRFENDKAGYRIGVGITGGVMGDGADCVGPDTMVETEIGQIPISDLVSMPNIPRVLSFNHSAKKLEWKRVVASRIIGNKNVIIVKTRSGREVYCTPEHRIYTKTGGYRPANSLGRDDALIARRQAYLCALQGTDKQKRDHLSRMSFEGKECFSNPEVLTLPNGIRSTAASACQGSEKRNKIISLFEIMRRSIRAQKGDRKKKPMQNMRHSLPAGAAKVLLSRVSINSATGQRENAWDWSVRILRNGIYVTQQSTSSLLSGMRERHPFKTHARCRQLALQEWLQLYNSLRFDATSYIGKGGKPVRGVRRAGKGYSSDASGRNEIAVDDRYTSYRPQSPEQRSAKSDRSMFRMPYDSSSLESDAVQLVSSICDGKVDVYDIQVDGNHNFFANGILVHNCVLIDDPQDRQAANSDAERDTANVTYDEAISTRLNDPAESAIVLIQQRLHQNDMTGHILDNDEEDWTHLMIPCLYEYDRHCATQFNGYTWEDPRRYDQETGDELEQDDCEGICFDPERFPPNVVETFRSRGPFFFSGQLQQIPTPSGGGIIKEEYWQWWPPEGWTPPARGEIVKFPPFDYVVAGLDTAMTDKEENDYSALAIMGVWRETGRYQISQRSSIQADGEAQDSLRIAMPDSERPHIMLMYAWQKRLLLHGPPEEKPSGMSDVDWNSRGIRKTRSANWGLVEWVVDTCREFGVHKLLIEDKAHGHAVNDELMRLYRNERWSVQLCTPYGDKVARVHAIQQLFSNGQVYAPAIFDHSLGYWRRPVWCDGVIRQFSVFPKGEHDDAVDATELCLRHLREIGMALRQGEAEDVWEDVVRGDGGSKKALYDL